MLCWSSAGILMSDPAWYRHYSALTLYVDALHSILKTEREKDAGNDWE